MESFLQRQELLVYAHLESPLDVEVDIVFFVFVSDWDVLTVGLEIIVCDSAKSVVFYAEGAVKHTIYVVFTVGGREGEGGRGREGGEVEREGDRGEEWGKGGREGQGKSEGRGREGGRKGKGGRERREGEREGEGKSEGRGGREKGEGWEGKEGGREGGKEENASRRGGGMKEQCKTYTYTYIRTLT